MFKEKRNQLVKETVCQTVAESHNTYFTFILWMCHHEWQVIEKKSENKKYICTNRVGFCRAACIFCHLLSYFYNKDVIYISASSLYMQNICMWSMSSSFRWNSSHVCCKLTLTLTVLNSFKINYSFIPYFSYFFLLILCMLLLYCCRSPV